jgi:hypothetical protein
MRLSRLALAVLLIFGVGCSVNHLDPYPVTMAIDRSCGELVQAVTHWFDRHPFFSGTLVCIGTALVVVGALALVLWAGSGGDN